LRAVDQESEVLESDVYREPREGGGLSFTAKALKRLLGVFLRRHAECLVGDQFVECEAVVS
jgi:hypothetical protein